MVQPSRRQLLGFGVVAATAAGPLGTASKALAAVAPPRLTRRTFQPLLGSSFRFGGASGRYNAVLSAVTDLPSSRQGDDHRFRLVFTVRGAGPRQGTYRFSSSRLAPFQLFVVPMGGGRSRYEAIVHSR